MSDPSTPLRAGPSTSPDDARWWTGEVRSRLSALSLSPMRETEIVDELSQHLADRWQELVAGGASADEATKMTLAAFRGRDVLARYLAPLRQANVRPAIAPGAPAGRTLSDLGQDVHYAARMLRKQPGFTIAALLTLALGIGANTAIFSLVNAVLFQPLPVENRERLFYLYRDADGAAPSLSYPAYAVLRDNTRLVESLIAWAGITASLNADGNTEMVSGVIVTGRYFDTLGVTALHGRVLNTADDVTPGAHSVAVISHRLWRQRFAAGTDIVGKDIRLNGHPFTIVGVMRANFPGAELGTVSDLYVPMMMQALMRPPRAAYSGEMNPDLLGNRNNGWLSALALLKPGVSREQAQAEIESVARADGAAVGRRPGPAPPAALVSIDAGNPGDRRELMSVAQLLFGVVGLVLLIACANVANLLLSKAVSRRREVAIRLALGARRARIVRQLLTESVLLAVLGGLGGVLLALGMMHLFHAMPPPQSAVPIILDPAIDGRVLVFAMALSIGTGIIFGFAPAMQASRPGVVPALKDDGLLSDRHGRRFNLKKALVVAEVALSVVLLIGAGLFIRSLRAIQAVDPGVAVSELISAPLNINLLQYTKVQGRQFYQQLVERIEQLPGVASASVARIALLAGGSSRVAGVRVEGRVYPPPDGAPRGPVIGQNATFANVVGPRFFGTIGVPLVAGRDFAPTDLEDRPLVAIVNETMAQQFFPGENPIGKRFATGVSNASGEWTEIVGIARDSKSGDLSEGRVPLVYMPLSQRHESGVTLYVRTTLPPASLIPLIRREIQQLEPHLPVPAIEPMEATIATRLYPQRMGANLLAAFGGLAVLLASLGVYGVLAFSISRRRQELGVRIAVGANRRQIFALVLGEGLVLVAIGVAVGLVASANLAGLVASFLFGIDPRDAVTFAMVPILLAMVALVACYLPARRATLLNPVTALRSE